jgi:hypothetical protein
MNAGVANSAWNDGNQFAQTIARTFSENGRPSWLVPDFEG